MQDCHQKGVTDKRKCDSPKRGVRGIREMSQLTERCYGYQVRDMTAFVIRSCIVTHIKITIQSLYCHPMPYCDCNTNFFFIISFISLPYGYIDIAKAEISIYE